MEDCKSGTRAEHFLNEEARASSVCFKGQEEDRSLEENCGVFGIIGKANASRAAFFALYALNHRGQESAGIASFDQSGLHVHKGMGLVSQVFDEHDIEALSGDTAIGHTRYSTAGGSKLAGAQPFVLETDLGQLAIAHNGQVARHSALRKLVLGRGVGLFSNSDSEVIAQMLARPNDAAEAAAFSAKESSRLANNECSASVIPDIVEAPHRRASLSSTSPIWACWLARIAAFMRDCEGAYSLVAMTKDCLFGIRDAHGLRPLCVGRSKNLDGTWSYLLSSESCAFGTVGGEYVREVLPGEVVRVDRNGVRSWRPLIYPAIDVKASFSIPKSPSLCSFEYVYFARPDSIMEGQMIHSVRTRLGKVLAQESPAPEADLVSGVPDSSIAAAIGYAKHVNLPFSEVFCKNRYIGRTFIKPDEGLRKNAIQLKYNPLSEILTGKSIVLVDDSLVRGSTLRQLVPLLRKGGALKVHVRISSPPIRHPCYYGVDIGTYDELIATHKTTVEGIREYIGADSLEFLSHEGMIAAIEEGIPKVNDLGEAAVLGHCSSCMTGNYTISVQNEI